MSAHASGAPRGAARNRTRAAGKRQRAVRKNTSNRKRIELYAQKSQNGQRPGSSGFAPLDKMLQLKANQLINNNIT
jgi:hypothetical protein